MNVLSTAVYPNKKNMVLDKDYRTSKNFFKSDRMLSSYLAKNVSSDGLGYMYNNLTVIGKDAAGKMNELSLLADHKGPELVKRNFLGENIDEIRFHPSYWELMDIAVKSEMFRVKWEPSLRKKYKSELHQLGFSAGYLYSMSECGQYCPLCMTDGVARLIDLFCNEKDKERLLAHIYTDKANEFFTGAMFLTEKTGGSDVGANIVTATPAAVPGYYFLNGEKWFCSNANADLIFALARTDEKTKGTKGLSIFLVEKHLSEEAFAFFRDRQDLRGDAAGNVRNPIDIVRVKDKLGVRSMASAECMLTDTIGKMVGNEFEGFKVMVEMISLSRLYNSVAALATSRRALIEAYQFLCHRKSFGKTAIEHALIRTKLTELGALNTANFYLTWRTIKSLDAADNGNEREAQLFRLINPMTKKWSAETGVYITRESMELMGGIGYIEDGVMPKLMRDVMVLPIWEGSGNIIILDMLRAMFKSKGFSILCEEITNSARKSEEHGSWLKDELNKLIVFSATVSKLSQDEMEASAKVFFTKLTTLFQVALMIDQQDEESNGWIAPSLHFLRENYAGEELKNTKPLSVDEVKGLVGWEF